MQLGDPSAAERAERDRLDVILDQLNDDISELVEAVDAGALDQLDAAEKVAFGSGSRHCGIGCRWSITS
jgi:hypothetical protein